MKYLYITRFLDVRHVKIGVVDDPTEIELDAISGNEHILDVHNIDYLFGTDKQVSLIHDYLLLRFGETLNMIDRANGIYAFEIEHSILYHISQLAESMNIPDLLYYDRINVLGLESSS